MGKKFCDLICIFNFKSLSYNIALPKEFMVHNIKLSIFGF